MLRLAGLLLLAASTLHADEIPEHDRRLTEVLHTNTEFKNPIPNYTAEEWEVRREGLRKQILSAAGLLPMPVKTDLRPEIFGRLERDGYSVEKVILQTYPGFYLGGNLYRPLGRTGKLPAIASPHGHWTYGRLEHHEVNSVPARAVNLARQGYVVFTYDMVGYNDTRQFPHAQIGGQREELWSVELLGLQLWNSIRVVDFLESLTEVDRTRIGATGASGGATQVMMLSAVDDRVSFSAPVNMVSGLMQGGSPCENAANLRVDTNNVEIAALAAPRPMLIVSATGDWTRNVPQVEGPAVRDIYALFDASNQVDVVQFDSPHNYHKDSREAVYRFFGAKVLGDDNEEHFKEKAPYVEQLSSMLAFWGATLPVGAVDLQTFIGERIGDANEQVQQRKPYDADSLRKARADFRDWLRYSLLAGEPEEGDLLSETIDTLPNGEKLVLGRKGKGDRIPAALVEASKVNDAVKPTLIVHPEGSAWVMSSASSRVGLVSEILYRGGRVMGVDVYRTGRAETVEPATPPNERAQEYFSTFNRSDTAERIQDVLTAIAAARSRFGTKDIQLYCPGETGLWCALARALADGPIDLAADLQAFDTTSDAAYLDRLFVPGLRKAGDFRAAATLWTGGRLLLWNAHPSFPIKWVESSFFAAGDPAGAEVRATPLTDGEALLWLGATADR